jgi:exodeoxyribonuclease X
MSKILIGDTETTGLIEPIQPIELAWLEIDYPSLVPLETFNMKYKPSKPIELGALCTSHILLSELEGYPSWETCKLPEDTEYIIGHNIDYDWKVLGSPDVKRIDTKALSSYMFPNLDSHRQSSMLYHFMGDAAKPLLKEAHNALCDVENCLRLLAYLVDHIKTEYMENVNPKTIEALYELSETARIPTKLHFGKFKGQPYGALDIGYIKWWMYTSDNPPDMYQMKAIRNAGFKI